LCSPLIAVELGLIKGDIDSLLDIAGIEKEKIVSQHSETFQPGEKASS
jgi:hypothetical protein